MTSMYERTVSRDESRRGYLFILKNHLPFFPKIGAPFIIRAFGKNKKAKVESYRCQCQGPDKPHEHFYIRWSGLAKGDHLIVKKISNDQPLYSFRVEENL